MKSHVTKLAILSAAIIGLSACASKPPVREAAPIVDNTQDRAPAAPAERVTAPSQPTNVFDGPAPGSVEDFRVNVGERIYFDTNGYDIDQFDREILNRQAAWLQSYPNVSVLIAGNADERGTREFNLALGERRANSVKDYLVSQGISPARLETISYGKERPIDGRSTEEAWAVNRNALTQINDGRIG